MQRGRGRAPFEGGLLNFQGHSHGPLARGREKARGRRRRRKGGEGQGKRKRASRRGGGQVEARHENSLLNRLRTRAIRGPSNGPTDRQTGRPIRLFGAPFRAPGARDRRVASRRRASSFPNVRRSRKPGAHSARNQFSEARQGLRFPLRPPETTGVREREHERQQRNSQGRAKVSRRDSLSAVPLLDPPRESREREMKRGSGTRLRKKIGKTEKLYGSKLQNKGGER